MINKRSTPKIIAVSMGDAAGVGPELCLRLLARSDFPDGAVPLVIGSAALLARGAEQVRLLFKAPCLDAPPATLAAPAVLDIPGALAHDAVEPGQNQAICGAAAARYIQEGVRGCLSGQYAALVTAPISKKALNMAGIDFPGHTEMLAQLTRSPDYAMLLYSERIACAFVTCHQSLRSVPEALTVERVVSVTVMTWARMHAIRGKAPRMALLGLNPHAGEDGLFGDEEQRILIPSLKTLKERGIAIEGPLPPDTAFTPAALARYDCHIAMYHDQGSIPFKMLAFDTGVNLTMDLPIVRTSPDHGTAFDIAWQGKASPASFFAAYDLAAKFSKRRGRAVRSRQPSSATDSGSNPRHD